MVTFHITQVKVYPGYLPYSIIVSSHDVCLLARKNKNKATYLLYYPHPTQEFHTHETRVRKEAEEELVSCPTEAERKRQMDHNS